MVLILTGCAAGPAKRSGGCVPKVGMSSAELVDCGCQPHQPRASSAGVISDSLGDRRVTTVVSLSYLCHDPRSGFALVSVTNGVASAIYR
jgi:hypothetical protein